MSDELINEWVIKAEEDCRTMEALYNNSPSGFANSICFHAQQCVEKYLKALITKQGSRKQVRWLTILNFKCVNILPIQPGEKNKEMALFNLQTVAFGFGKTEGS